MTSELNLLPNSEKVIELNLPNLSFDLDPSPTQDSSGIYGKSDFTMTVINKVNSYVAIRTKTTKKDVYAVNPTYGIISPNSAIEIKFVYYIKNLNEDPKKHKFKFEGIAIEKAIPEKDVKKLFDYYIQNSIQVVGTAIKAEVVFNYVNKKKEDDMTISVVKGAPPKLDNSANDPSNYNQKIGTYTANPQSSPNFNEDQNRTDFPQFKSINMSQTQKPIIKDKQAEQLLQDLKMDYLKYRNQLNSLIETHKTIKNRVEMEKSKEVSAAHSSNAPVYSTPDEKQIPKKLTIIIIICSVVLGFVLSR